MKITTNRSIRRSAKITEREVTVLRRYAIKVNHNDLHAGDVVLIVRNDRGVEYKVTLRKGTKRHECNCASWKPCYHINAMAKAENARWEAERDAAKAVVVEMVETVVEPKVVVENTKPVIDLAKTKLPTAPKVDLSTRGNLNGNRAFSLMR